MESHLLSEILSISGIGISAHWAWEASPNVLHNDEQSPFASCYTFTRPSYYFTSPSPWYNHAIEDPASSCRHQNPNITLCINPGGLVIYRRTMRPRSALPPQLCLSMSTSTMLTIQGTRSQCIVHGKKHIFYSGDPIVDLPDEHRAHG